MQQNLLTWRTIIFARGGNAMTGWIITGIIAVLVIMAAFVKLAGRWSRYEEKKDNQLNKNIGVYYGKIS